MSQQFINLLSVVADTFMILGVLIISLKEAGVFIRRRRRRRFDEFDSEIREIIDHNFEKLRSEIKTDVFKKTI